MPKIRTMNNVMVGPFDSMLEAEDAKEAFEGMVVTQPNMVYQDMFGAEKDFDKKEDKEGTKYYFMAMPYFTPKVVNQYERIMNEAADLDVLFERVNGSVVVNKPDALVDADGGLCLVEKQEDFDNWRTCKGCWENKFGLKATYTYELPITPEVIEEQEPEFVDMKIRKPKKVLDEEGRRCKALAEEDKSRNWKTCRYCWERRFGMRILAVHKDFDPELVLIMD